MTDYESEHHYGSGHTDGRAPLHLRIAPGLKQRLDVVIPRGRRNDLFDVLLEDLLPLLESDKGPAVLAAIYERRLRARQILREAAQHGDASGHETKLPRTLTRGEAGSDSPD